MQLQRVRLVGASGFEPPASWSRTRRSSQAEPRPENAQIRIIRSLRDNRPCRNRPVPQPRNNQPLQVAQRLFAVRNARRDYRAAEDFASDFVSGVLRPNTRTK